MRNFSTGESCGIAATYLAGLGAAVYHREALLAPLLSGNVWADGLAVSAAVNGVGFLCGLKGNSFRHFDATGAVANLATILTAMAGNPAAPVQAIGGLAVAWVTRLGTFLTFRAANHGDDKRLEKFKASPGKMAAVWILQVVWGYATLLPVLVAAYSATPLDAPPIASGVCPVSLQAAGCVLAGLGLVVEATADHQKLVFKNANPEKFMRTGLFRWCRYPNYLGEITVWTGLAAAAAHYASADRDHPYLMTALAAASPVFVYSLLRYASGVPILEKSAAKRYGHLPEYQRYKARTSLLFPGF
eukprot:TRINITY_DN41_c0_g1_i2.p1 TRINITY_DN41_c0_g1~~TRINITY_DN41_c0_g1_i2.p1  ORF type:complete len:302 (+),score=100.10 TRINITY_DN41_c0_g1_i2:60-965(+)